MIEVAERADDVVVTEARATAHAVEEFVPKPQRERRGIALCLSGGGFRAALFHLGALRRLNELGVLTQVDTLSTVSGGSIVGAHLVGQAAQWATPGTVIPDWETRVAEPFRAFTARNIRTGPLAKRLLPWNWFDSGTAVKALADTYERWLIDTNFGDLPARPRFIFCATDMAFGVNWTFDSGRVDGPIRRFGDYQAGFTRDLPDWPVARAVAASSCFPPLFDPLRVGLAADLLFDGKYAKPDRAALVGGVLLSDGGVYDNMGLEPVWKDHRVVLVSDGGATFEGEADRGFLWRVQRYVAVVDGQSRALRRRWLIASFIRDVLEGTYWGVGSSTAHYDVPTPGYSEALVDDVVSEVRTDLDAFSAAEAAVLENHGYLMAEAAIRRHLPNLIKTQALLDVPHPAWLDEERIRAALARSHKRTLLGRR
jgi:NTE family protein